MATGKRVFPPPEAGDATPLGPAEFMALDQDQATLYSGGSDGYVHVWDLQLSKAEVSWKSNGGAVTDLELSPDGDRLLVGLPMGACAVLDTNTGNEIFEIVPATRKNPTRTKAWIEEGGAILGPDSDGKKLSVFNGKKSGDLKKEYDVASKLAASPFNLAASRDGAWAALVTQTQGTYFWNNALGDIMGEHLDAGGATAVTAISLDGRTMLIADDRGLHGYGSLVDDKAKPAKEALAQWVRDFGSGQLPGPGKGDAGAAGGGQGRAGGPGPGQHGGRGSGGAGEVHPRAWQGGVSARQGAGKVLPLEEKVSGLAVDPAGKNWVAVLGQGSAALLQFGEITEQGLKATVRTEPGAMPSSVLFSDDGQTLFVGYMTGTIDLYDVP